MVELTWYNMLCHWNWIKKLTPFRPCHGCYPCLSYLGMQNYLSVPWCWDHPVAPYDDSHRHPEKSCTHARTHVWVVGKCFLVDFRLLILDLQLRDNLRLCLFCPTQNREVEAEKYRLSFSPPPIFELEYIVWKRTLELSLTQILTVCCMLQHLTAENCRDTINGANKD